MADEILIKVRADLDGFSAEMNEAKKIGNSAIQEIEKNDLFSKANSNAKDLKKSLELIAKASNDVNLKNFNADEVINDTNKLKKLIEQLSQTLKGMKAGTAEFKSLDAIVKSANVQLEKLNVTTEKTGKSLRTQMREAQLEVAKLSEKFGATSQQAIEAAKRAAQLKDQIGDAKALTDAFNPDAKFNALSKSITGVASGFSAFQGAIGLLGSESEDVQKTLLKVQSALALSQGLQGLGEAKDSFIQLGAVAKNALAGIRTAIGATGIGLLVVALGSVIAYWDEIKEAVSGVSRAQRDLSDKAKETLATSERQLKELSSQDEVLKLQGKSEREILSLKLKNLQNIKEQQIASLKAIAVVEVAELKASQNRQRQLVKYLGFVGVLINELTGDDKIQSKIDNRLKDLQTDLKGLNEEEAKFKNQIAEIDKKADEEASKKRKEANDKRLKAEQEWNDNLQKLRKQGKEIEASEIQKIFEATQKANEQVEDSTLSREESEKRAVNDKYFYLITKAKEYNIDTVELEKAKLLELTSINEKYQKEREDAEKKQADYQAKLDEQSAKTRKEENDKEIALIKSKFDLINEYASNGILLQIGLNPQDIARLSASVKSITDSIADGKAIDANQIAQTAGSTYFAVSNAIASAQKQRTEEELSELKAKQDEELRLAGDNEQKKEIIRQKYALKEKEVKRKQAEADKRKAIMDAVINTAVAVVKSLPNFVLAGIAGAIGAAQIALIAATPIPKFAKGGAVPSSDIQGMIDGRSHSAGGVLIEAEGNEFITRKSQAMKGDNLELLQAINMSDAERDKYINSHYVMPALQSKESKAKESYRHSIIEAENNLIARVSSHTLKSIHREQKNTTDAVNRLSKTNYNW